MMRRRLTPQEQLDAIRDVKLGMKRSDVMKKYHINYHSTLSQIIERRGHQVKLVKSGMSSSSSAAAAVLHRARNGKQPSQLSRPIIRCVIRNPHAHLMPRVSQISHIDPPNTKDPAAGSSRDPDHRAPLPQSSSSSLSKASSSSMNPSSTSAPPRRILPIEFFPRAGRRRRMATPMSMEDKIDMALSKISKLNQKLLIRQGQAVFCSCCNRAINFRYNTVVARVTEHCQTLSHVNSIQMTREQRHQEAADSANSDETDNGQVPLNGSSRSVDGPEPHTAFKSRGLRYDVQRVRGRFVRKDVSGHNASAASSARVPDPKEERAKRQPEFEKDLVQAFLETGVPIRKLNMYPMRDFLQKWTQMRVPRYEEQGLEYGF